MNLRVYWSDRLETMADRMLDEWSAGTGGPFGRTCVVVGDMATRNWLKDRFLLHRAPGARRVLANVDFAPLPELANDWLAAAVHGAGGAPRDPADHPFSRGVMAWRIEAVLRREEGNPAFGTLRRYVRAGGDGAADRRRFDLATRLARLFDDYLVSRHAMLRAWERGEVPPGGDGRWQALLYRELARGAGSYAADWATALAPGFDAERAFEHGFPRYDAIHAFDVSEAPWPYLALLGKIAESVPVSVWTFNPFHGFWLENPTKRQRLRERAAVLRGALERGQTPPAEEDDADFSTPDARLLGALAAGARGLLAQELDLAGGDCEWLGGEGSFATLRAARTEVHVCHSPRRELEAARDALHRFFDENRDAKPSDALVLCADWAAYSPLVEAVFGGKDGAGLPVATAGIRASTPVTHAFGELLGFRTNRFEVSKVFALLGVPEIRGKFGIGAEGVPVLRDLVRRHNVHWGWDDADVRASLGTPEAADDGGPARFTWRRGLDRLVLDALLGPRPDEGALVEAGALGRLLPGGHVESERARLVGALHRFAARLAKLREFLRTPHSAERWRDGLLAAIDDFYEADDAVLGEILGLRRAVETAAAAAVRARETDRRPAKETVSGDVFCRAALDAVADGSRRLDSAGDAVRVAPLAAGSAVPARFVWICGLGDGAFPRDECRPSFDLVGRHPTMYDVEPRQRDALALLKASLGARDKLCLSYVGRDIRTNAALPPSVPLADLLEWFRASGLAVRTHVHPLQAHGTARFAAASDLPPSYSAANRAAAAALAAARAGGPAAEPPQPPRVVPFPPGEDGETAIDLDDLARFCGSPNRFLAERRLGIRADNPGFARLDDDDGLDERLPRELAAEILVRGGAAAADAAAQAEKWMEAGVSLPAAKIAALAETAAAETAGYRERPLAYKKSEADGFAVPGKTAAEALAAWQDGATATAFRADLSVDGRAVRVSGACRTVPLDVLPSGTVDHEFVFSRYPEVFPSMRIGAWVRHVAAHAAGLRFVTAMMCGKDGPVRTYRPLPRAEAEELLANLVRLASLPYPFDARKAVDPKADEPEGELADALAGSKTRLVSTQKPKGAKK